MTEFLNTIRNGHAALSIVCLAIIAFCVSPNDAKRFADAESEIATLQHLDYASYVAFVQPTFDRSAKQAEQVTVEAYHRSGVQTSSDFSVERPQIILFPGASATVGDSVRFFEQRTDLMTLSVVVPGDEENEDDDLYPIQMVNNFKYRCGMRCRDISVSQVDIRWDKQEPSFADYAVSFRSLPLEKNASGSMKVWITYVDLTTGFKNVRTLDLHGLQLFVGQDISGSFATDWLRTQPAGAVLAPKQWNQVHSFPALHAAWDEVDKQSRDDAARYLAERVESHVASLSFAGIPVDTRILTLAGPIVLFAALAFLLSAIRMTNLAIDKTPTLKPSLYPWLGLYDDRLSRGAVFLSVVVLPIAAAISIGYVAWDSRNRLAMMLDCTIIITIVILSVLCLRELRRLRVAFGEATIRLEADPQ